MKRFLCLCLALALSLGLCACGGRSAAPAEPAAEVFQTLRHAEITVKDYGSIRLENSF